jgi:hypothetical protein
MNHFDYTPLPHPLGKYFAHPFFFSFFGANVINLIKIRSLTAENAAAMGIKNFDKLRCTTHVHISSYLAHLNTKYWDNPME